MNLKDKLKSAHSFNGDPLHREAWEEIERLEEIISNMTIEASILWGIGASALFENNETDEERDLYDRRQDHEEPDQQ